jgi:hypothetical protein
MDWRERKFQRLDELDPESALEEAQRLLDSGKTKEAEFLASAVTSATCFIREEEAQRLSGRADLIKALSYEALGKLGKAAHYFAIAGLQLRCPRTLLRAARTHARSREWYSSKSQVRFLLDRTISSFSWEHQPELLEEILDERRRVVELELPEKSTGVDERLLEKAAAALSEGRNHGAYQEAEYVKPEELSGDRTVAAQALLIQAQARWNLKEPLQAAVLFAQAGQAGSSAPAYVSAARAALTVPVEELDMRGYAGEWFDQAIAIFIEIGEPAQAESLLGERAGLPCVQTKEILEAGEHALASGKPADADALARALLLRDPRNAGALRIRSRAYQAVDEPVPAAIYAHAAKQLESVGG